MIKQAILRTFNQDPTHSTIDWIAKRWLGSAVDVTSILEEFVSCCPPSLKEFAFLFRIQLVCTIEMTLHARLLLDKYCNVYDRRWQVRRPHSPSTALPTCLCNFDLEEWQANGIRDFWPSTKSRWRKCWNRASASAKKTASCIRLASDWLRRVWIPRVVNPQHPLTMIKRAILRQIR